MLDFEYVVNIIQQYKTPFKLRAIDTVMSKGYDKKKEAWSKIYIQFNLVVEEPSEEHSKFRSIPLIPQSEYQEDNLKKIFTRLKKISDSFKIEFHNPDLTNEYNQTWIQVQEASKMIKWSVKWTTTQWSKSGEKIIQNGIKSVSANNGNSANGKVVQFFENNLSKPFILEINIEELSEQENYSGFKCFSMAKYPKNGISMHKIREVAQEKFDYLDVIKWIKSDIKKWSIKDIMIAFYYSFDIEFEEIEKLKDWENKLINDNEFNQILSLVINSKKDKWLNKYRMRKAFKSGVKPSIFVPKINPHQTVLNLKEEFGFSLLAVKEMSHYLFYEKNPKEFDKMFFKEIENLNSTIKKH